MAKKRKAAKKSTKKRPAKRKGAKKSTKKRSSKKGAKKRSTKKRSTKKRGPSARQPRLRRPRLPSSSSFCVRVGDRPRSRPEPGLARGGLSTQSCNDDEKPAGRRITARPAGLFLERSDGFVRRFDGLWSGLHRTFARHSSTVSGPDQGSVTLSDTSSDRYLKPILNPEP